MKLTARDIGFAIRDFIEDACIYHVEGDAETDYIELLAPHQVSSIDISDPDNPIIHMDNGQSFRVRIFVNNNQ